MTTNAGAESLARTQMGFTPSTKLGDEMERSSACSRPSSATGSTR